MARIGNWDVTLNKQGWFDTVAGDPLNGWFDYTAIGATGTDIDLAPPGIPSAESQGLPKPIGIIQAPGIPSAEGTAPAFVAALVTSPGIPSAETEAPPQAAIVITPAAIPSAEVEAPAQITVTPPPPPASGGHGGMPPPPANTRAPRPPPEPEEQPSQWNWNPNEPWPSDEQFAARGEAAKVYPWLGADAFANDTDWNAPSPPPNVHVLDRFGPLKELPENEFLVAGSISEDPWKWILVGAAAATAIGVGLHYMNKKSPKTAPARKSAPKRTSAPPAAKKSVAKKTATRSH